MLVAFLNCTITFMDTTEAYIQQFSEGKEIIFKMILKYIKNNHYSFNQYRHKWGKLDICQY